MSPPHPPLPPPKSPRMDHSTTLPGIHSHLEDKHKHHPERDRQSHRVDDNINQGTSGQAAPHAHALGQTHFHSQSHGHSQVGPVHHPLGRIAAREGYPPTHQYPDQTRRNGNEPSLPPPIKTTNHHGDPHQTASTPTPRLNIQPPSPPSPTGPDAYSSTGTGQPLRPSHLNHKTIHPHTHTVQREMGLVELERQDNRPTREAAARAEAGAGGIASSEEIGGISRVGSGGIGVGGTEGGATHGSSHGVGQGNGQTQGQGMMGRFKTTFLSKNRGPMSKTWAKKSYLDDLETIGSSSPTSPTRSNWVGPGSRSAPVSPADLEGQRRPG